MATISEKPWSDYTSADYSVEQWHAACLIHLHDGTPTSKNECKLPVKTPNGTINRNGVHAAAAALAGARGGVHASMEQKSSASRMLRTMYSKLEEEPPESLKQSAIDEAEKFIKHYGVKGMKWGVRRRDRSKLRQGPSDDAKTAHKALVKSKISGVEALTNKELNALNNRLNLEQNYTRLSYSPGKLKKGLDAVSGLLKTGNTLNDAAKFADSPVGKKMVANLSKKTAASAPKHLKK